MNRQDRKRSWEESDDWTISAGCFRISEMNKTMFKPLGGVELTNIIRLNCLFLDYLYV